MEIPKVFISYSHDSLPHKEWILNLGSRLRQNGIDAILDQWELTAGDDLPHFMEKYLSAADYILMICTNRYVEKANGGKGGVGYEKMIITSNLMDKIDENKIIPIIRNNDTSSVPTFLKTKLYISFLRDDNYESSFDELIRKIHKSPIFIKPEIGFNPFKGNVPLEEKKNHSNLHDFMVGVINVYEQIDSQYITQKAVRSALNISRISFDIALQEAIDKKYIRLDTDGDIYLLQVGKLYAIQNGIVK